MNYDCQTGLLDHMQIWWTIQFTLKVGLIQSQTCLVMRLQTHPPVHLNTAALPTQFMQWLIAAARI